MRLIIPVRVSTALLGAHALTGVLFAWALYLVCFSGTLAVLADEFSLWEQPRPPLVGAASPDLVAAVTTRGYALAKISGQPLETLYVAAPTPTLPQLVVSAGNGAESGQSWQADAAGRLRPAADAPWTQFMRMHHHDFNLPDPYGDYLVGILGTLLIAGLMSGLFAHRRIFRDAFRLRWGGSRRRSNADLHNRIGVWAFPFHLIVSLTGSLLGLAGLIIGVLALIAYQGDTEKAVRALTGPQATADARPAPLPDLRPMMRTIEARAPGSTIAAVLVGKPGTKGQIATIYTAAPGHLTRAESWSFAPDGRLLEKAGFTDGSVGMRIYGMITPLHYGTYGGLPLKLIYVLLGASLTTLVASGLAIWLARRREQGRAAPRRERLWAALVWSQPLAFATSALLSITAEAHPLRIFWRVTLAAAALAVTQAEPKRIVSGLRGAGGLALIGLAITHMIVRGHSPALDLVLVALALVMMATEASSAPRSIAQWRTSRAGPSMADA